MESGEEDVIGGAHVDKSFNPDDALLACIIECTTGLEIVVGIVNESDTSRECVVMSTYLPESNQVEGVEEVHECDKDVEG